MAITKARKKEILDRLESINKDSKTVVFVGFNGLTVSDSTAMRNTLRDQGVGYFVAKKTLIGRVLGAGYEGSMPTLDGEVALAYSEDPTLPAQQIREFEKKFKDKVAILGGVFAGAYKNREEMTEIAAIPALPVLRGMFVNVINSPIQGLAVALGQIAAKKGA